MSNDLQIVNGDLAITPDGDLNLISESTKLRQDLLKISLTTQGTNRYHPWYGNAVGLANIGQSAHLPSTVKSIASTTLKESLGNLILLQREQRLRQEVTPGEAILNIKDIIVEQDEIDPRQYNIKYFVVNESLLEVTDGLLFRPF